MKAGRGLGGKQSTHWLAALRQSRDPRLTGTVGSNRAMRQPFKASAGDLPITFGWFDIRSDLFFTLAEPPKAVIDRLDTHFLGVLDSPRLRLRADHARAGLALRQFYDVTCG